MTSTSSSRRPRRRPRASGRSHGRSAGAEGPRRRATTSVSSPPARRRSTVSSDRRPTSARAGPATRAQVRGAASQMRSSRRGRSGPASHARCGPRAARVGRPGCTAGWRRCASKRRSRPARTGRRAAPPARAGSGARSPRVQHRAAAHVDRGHGARAEHRGARPRMPLPVHRSRRDARGGSPLPSRAARPAGGSRWGSKTPGKAIDRARCRR